MTDRNPQVTDAFERLFPIPNVIEDWSAVLEGSGEARRGRRKPLVRRRTLAFAAVALLVGALLVAPAFGFGERLLDLVRPAAAPPGSDGEYPWRHPTWSPDGRRILVSKLVADNTLTLYVMDADGTGLRILARHTDHAPAWSPDGRTVAVVRYPRGAAPPPQPETVNLYVLDADGSGGGLVAKAFPASPAWSPDGTKIAFVRSRGGTVDVYVANADGTRTQRLARGVRLTGDPSSDQGPLPQPAWSPDGRRIAFISDRSGTNDLWMMDADGSDQRRLTRNSATESGPVWSPDGRRIAFARRAGEHWSNNDDLYVIRSDGTGLRNLTHGTPPDIYKPVWSLDGRHIIFLSEGKGGIYVINTDGSGKQNLTPNRPQVGASDLSPDGRQILFGSGKDGISELHVMNRDGSDRHRLIQLP